MSDEQQPEPERTNLHRAKNPITPKGHPITVSQMFEHLLPPNPDFLRDIELALSEDLIRG